jgi:hypothetical protein
MKYISLTIVVSFLSLISSEYCAAQNTINTPENLIYTYSDIADKAVAASFVAQVRVRKATKVPAKIAGNVPLGATRFLVEAEVNSLLRSNVPMPQMIQYIIDLKPDSLGKKQRITKQSFVIFGSPGRAGEIRLLDAESQIPLSAPLDQMVRSVLTEATNPQAAPAIKGIQSAFYSPGALPGEGESQIFLSTDGERPVSLTIIREQDKAPRWFVSLSEVVDEAKAPPRRNTLLWYRLACSLPATLPESVVANGAAETAAKLREDYALTLKSMGACNRSPKK